jgi:hypothetical protein
MPDFSLSASPSSQAIAQGQTSTNYTITIVPIGGFNAAVDLAVTPLQGGGANFSPNPATGSSAMQVSATELTPAGTYTLTVYALAGGPAHSTTVTLVVSPCMTQVLAWSSPPGTAASGGQSPSYYSSWRCTTQQVAWTINCPLAGTQVRILIDASNWDFNPLFPSCGSGSAVTSPAYCCRNQWNLAIYATVNGTPTPITWTVTVSA